MTSFGPAEQLHRLIKYALDSGTAATLEEAETLFKGYRLTLSIGPDEAACPLHQAALLTAVALGRRVFLAVWPSKAMSILHWRSHSPWVVSSAMP